MTRPFEVSVEELTSNIDLYVNSIYSDLESDFLILPKGNNFVEYSRFQEAYECLKFSTNGFRAFEPQAIIEAFQKDSLCFLIVRTILGMTPPEWAQLASAETNVSVDQGAARTLDQATRKNKDYIAKQLSKPSKTGSRIIALIEVACKYITMTAPAGAADTVHRLAKVDTAEGLISIQRAADFHIPYAVLLYERYLGRPFASHRDSVSELIGDVMESAVENRLLDARISNRKTKRAERIPGFDQAPDFIIPDEYAPKVVIEAKITNDDGTARDKFTRIIHLAELSQQRQAQGLPGFQVIACIDGRGFGVRREDMRRLLLTLKGKVFTLKTLDRLVPNSDLNDFTPMKQP